MQRRTFLKVVGAAAILPATAALPGCSEHFPAEAIEGWQGPRDAADLRRWILSYSILAPHSHNLQSCIVDLRQPDEIVLYCDRTRLLPETDPYFRQIMMSHGAFLELLGLATRERGLRADMQLFPEGVFTASRIDERPVARIRLHPDPAISKDPLFGQILKRRTNRSPYDVRHRVSPDAWQSMIRAATEGGVQLGYVDAARPAVISEHRRIASDAWRVELTTARTVLESYRVLRIGAADILKHRDGISIMDPKLVWLDRFGLFDRSKAPGPDDFATTSQIDDFDSRLAATPSFLWLTTPGNDRFAQIQAGRAFVRAQLAAAAHGVSMQPLQQALQEYAEQRPNHHAIHRLCGATQPGQTVQMWARVGHAPSVHPAPRRALNNFIHS